MLDIAGRFALILSTLHAAVAAFLARQAQPPRALWLGTQLYVEQTAPSRHPPIPAETWRHLAAYTQRLAGRFTRLVQRWQSGTLPVPRQPGLPPPAKRGAPAGGAGTAATPKPQALRLPRARGWINKRIEAAAPCAGLLQALLHWPDLERLAHATPQAGRLLRPLSHALAVDLPPWLHLPRRGKPPVPPRAMPREPERGVPTIPPHTPYRPLQPNVRAAARAWKKYGA